MLLRDRPLLQDSIDAAIYLPRPPLEEPLLRAIRQGRNALLIGLPGSGKTTLLRRIEAALAKDGRRSVWINAGLIDDAEGLLEEVENGLVSLDREGGEQYSLAPRTSGLLSLSKAIAAHRPAVILVDGLLDEEVGFDLFGRLRDELWAAGHDWLVAVAPQRAATLRTPPAEAFWSVVVEIPPLGPDEVSDLLDRGLDDEERRKLKSNSPIAGLHPRALIREVERVLDGDEEQDQRIGILTTVAGKLGRSEEMAMTELIGLGRPASTHDPELLDRLGWSRAYAQRIFAALESAGLVKTMSEPSKDRSGRPRKLYMPNLKLPT